MLINNRCSNLTNSDSYDSFHATGSDLRDKELENLHLGPPGAYDVHSNGKHDAVETRPQPVVRDEDCVGCRLCYNVCPVDDCITMVEVASGRESVTWSELSEKKTEITEDWDAMKEYRKKAGIHIH